MPESTPGAGKGLLDSLSALAVTLLAIAHTRLELLSTDLEEERAHLFSLLVWALGALFCLGIGVVLATILVVVAFWDTQRVLVLAVLTGVFLLAGTLAWAYVSHKIRTKPRFFAASLSELHKDRLHLSP